MSIESDLYNALPPGVIVPSGSVSAELGIGVLKRKFLAKSRSADEIATMRTIKRALDPLSLSLNPGKIFA
jgi:FAD/FMN-containing dehydrogenase